MRGIHRCSPFASLFLLPLFLIGCDRASDVVGPTPDLVRSVASASAAVHAAGGGTTTFGVDLDGDGLVNLTHFGFTAVISPDHTAQGHFTCLMAGNAVFLGLKLMAVQGRVTAGEPDGTSFGGTATVKVLQAFGNGQASFLQNVPYSVTISPGGPGVGTLQLTVHGVFDGVAGDIAPGNGDYDLATETVRTGGITIR